MNQKRNGFSSGKQLFFLFLLFFCLEPVLSASPLSNAAGEFEYPTAGVIFPEQGTIQITTTPNTDLKDLRDGWPFAVCIRGEKILPRPEPPSGSTPIPERAMDFPPLCGEQTGKTVTRSTAIPP